MKYSEVTLRMGRGGGQTKGDGVPEPAVLLDPMTHTSPNTDKKDAEAQKRAGVRPQHWPQKKKKNQIILRQIIYISVGKKKLNKKKLKRKLSSDKWHPLQSRYRQKGTEEKGAPMN